jgi:hypothetical protein
VVKRHTNLREMSLLKIPCATSKTLRDAQTTKQLSKRRPWTSISSSFPFYLKNLRLRLEETSATSHPPLPPPSCALLAYSLTNALSCTITQSLPPACTHELAQSLALFHSIFLVLVRALSLPAFVSFLYFPCDTNEDHKWQCLFHFHFLKDKKVELNFNNATAIAIQLRVNTKSCWYRH